MSSRVVCYFAAIAVILTSNMIFPVKGQCTLEGCENGDSSNSIVEEIQQLRVEIFGVLKKQVQGIQDLTKSQQEMKSQLETAQAGIRNLTGSLREMKSPLETAQADCMKNQIQNTWKAQTADEISFEEVPILQSPVSDWIVLMHRFDGSLNFTRSWNEYKNGFGDIGGGEFWLGNEKIHRLTNKLDYTLRIEVELVTSSRRAYADYATFAVESENKKYAIHLSGFSGNAGNSLFDPSSTMHHNGKNFSTLDNDNDKSPSNCAQAYYAGWWFDSCYNSCLTCPYNGGNFQWTRSTDLQLNGMLRSVRMMIKRK